MNQTGSDATKPLRLAVIGGGFTGAILVIHAARVTSRALDVTVLEPSADLGRGIAYGTRDPSHRINVPSDRMALSSGDPKEATRWFFTNGMLPDAASDDGQGQFYPSREAYGSFMADALRSSVAGAGERVTLRHRRVRATDVTGSAGCWQVTCDDGERLEADIVALCFGHAVPAVPCPVARAVWDNPRFVLDPWAPDALSAIAPADSVLIVGTGLTMADVAASLQARRHAGAVTAISRRGLLPRPHGLFLSDLDLFDGAPPPRTALGLLTLLRRRVRRDGASLGWQPVIDALRFALPVVWAGLPAVEKRKVLRRLLPFWEVHRFRIAPQIDAGLKQARAEGRLSVERAGLIGLDLRQEQFVATLRLPNGRAQERRFDAVVLCTGPDRDLRHNPLMASLLAGGLVRLDEVGVGVAVDTRSRVIDTQGRVRPGLLAFGPMTRGSFGEMTGAPDIARHVERVVGEVLNPHPLKEIL